MVKIWFEGYVPPPCLLLWWDNWVQLSAFSDLVLVSSLLIFILLTITTLWWLILAFLEKTEFLNWFWVYWNTNMTIDCEAVQRTSRETPRHILVTIQPLALQNNSHFFLIKKILWIHHFIISNFFCTIWEEVYNERTWEKSKWIHRGVENPLFNKKKRCKDIKFSKMFLFFKNGFSTPLCIGLLKDFLLPLNNTYGLILSSWQVLGAIKFAGNSLTT